MNRTKETKIVLSESMIYETANIFKLQKEEWHHNCTHVVAYNNKHYCTAFTVLTVSTVLAALAPPSSYANRHRLRIVLSGNKKAKQQTAINKQLL